MDLFRNPAWLAWLAAWLLFAWLLVRFAAARRARLAAIFGRPETLARLAPAETQARRGWKTGLQAAGIACLFLALAGPQWGIELVSSQAWGVEAIVAVDTSRSMLAEDVSNGRIAKAKSELEQVLDGLKGQRVGILAFAGKAQIVCPMTTDVEAAKTMLDEIHVGMIPQQGTAIGEAISLGAKFLSRTPGQKALVLISDGEDRRGDPLGAAKAASSAGVHLYVVGVGTPEGGPIPIRDANGTMTGYMRDKDGGTVVTRLAETSLIGLAAAAGGAYYRATPQETEASAILKHIYEMDRSRIQSGSTNQFQNRFRLPLALGLLLLLAEMLIGERARPPVVQETKERRRKPRPLAAPASLLACLAFWAAGCGLPANFDLWGGNRSYAKGDFDKAAERYAVAARRAPADPRPAFNAGATDYRREQLDAAAEGFQQVAESSGTPRRIASSSWYNLGNTRYKQQDYGRAAQAYRRCLLLDPKDEDCRYNLIQALKAKKNPPPKQDKKKDDQQPRQDKPKDQDQNQQPPPSKPRPRAGQMSQEDAERILQAVQEKEKQTLQQQQTRRRSVQQPPQEEDW